MSLEFREEKKRTASTQNGDVFTVEHGPDTDWRVWMTAQYDFDGEEESRTFTLLGEEASSLANELTNGRLALLVKAARRVDGVAFENQNVCGVAFENQKLSLANFKAALDAFAGEFEP